MFTQTKRFVGVRIKSLVEVGPGAQKVVFTHPNCHNLCWSHNIKYIYITLIDLIVYWSRPPRRRLCSGGSLLLCCCSSSLPPPSRSLLLIVIPDFLSAPCMYFLFKPRDSSPQIPTETPGKYQPSNLATSNSPSFSAGLRAFSSS